MNPVGYTEDSLVEQPAIRLLSELGWETVNAYNEFDSAKSFLGRDSKGDFILPERLKGALRRLNPDIPPEAVDEAVEEISKDRSMMSMAAANREIYNLLKHGVRVTVPDLEGGGETVEFARLIDWQNPGNNDFLLCSQFWMTGEMHTRRADLVGFVNGLPLVLFELKAAHRRLKTAYSGNLKDYKDTIPQLFWPNAFIILSNGSQSRIGTVTAEWEHFAEWKKVGSEDEEGRVSLETMLRGVCEPSSFLDIVENFTVFQDVSGGMVKIVSKNHQYLGVNNAISALQDVRNREGKLGVFWHTQGSGKSISMLFFAQKVMRKMEGNWTFVIVTDRQELDKQIYKNFTSSEVITEGQARAKSSAHLRQLLTEDHRYVFTLIHKFRTESGEKHPVLSSRNDIIVITDEAHRTQYDVLAMNMRAALPGAAFLAFTGTPLIIGEERTRDVFGDYVSIYDFQQSVMDGSTVPLYYENRIPELQLTNENLNEDMERLLEEAELDEEQEKKLAREFSREYHLITRDDRLEAIAKDIVEHFTARGFRGKAMMLCIDKATAVRMYGKVMAHWQDKLKELRDRVQSLREEDRDEVEEQISFMKETDMAVVVSQGQNEISEMEEKGLDIRPHRKRMLEDDLETKFKDPEDPFRLVFVCAMWMTGFDVPTCSTLYLDKPMKNHTLMQAIARANRVYPGKVSGLIVDYVGVFRNLERALSVYGTGRAGERPVEDKAALKEALRRAIDETKALCLENGIEIAEIQAAEGFEKIKLLDDAVDSLVGSEDLKRRFRDAANRVERIYKGILPDKDAHEFIAEVAVIQTIAKKILALAPSVDISLVMEQVGELLDDSIEAEGYIIKEKGAEYERWVDLSNIDFENLAERFKTGRKKTINEKLKGSVAVKIATLVKQNRMRIDYLEKFQAMIDEYNAGTINAEELFRRLVEISKELGEEENRSVREQLNEEELAVFDLLTKPDMELSDSDRDRVKQTARKLLSTLKKEKLVLDWRKRQQSRAEVRVTIEEMLDEGLPEIYTPSLFEQKTGAVFQHVYEAYYGQGRSVYAPR